MISRFQFLFAAVLGSTALTATLPQASAQTPAAAEADGHPAVKVVRDYLRMILARQWNESADIVDEDSLKGLQEDYIGRLKQAPTMDEEEAMTRRVGKGSVDEVKQMKPKDFYTAYHKGLQERYKVEEEVLEVIRKSLTLKVLSIAPEGDDMVHVLVRTKHSNGRMIIENLELVSLLKKGGKWRVGLNERAPRVTKLDGTAPDGKAAAADPVKPAAADPVKPKPPVTPKRK